MTGILIVDKPEGWTSQDVTAKLRGVFHERRIGHGGTLDPMATGVLPVFIGRATRAVPFFEAADKEYIVGIRFGCCTDTQDITGNILEESSLRPTEEAFSAALAEMQGPLDQIPPMYSAIKIGGQKLYELARAGKEVERKPRHIELKELELISFTGEEAVFRLFCSKGTYARTVCHDLGQKLGCGACMSSLRRSKAGRYTLADSFTMEDIIAGKATVLAADSLFADRPAVTLNALQHERCLHGNALQIPGLPDGEYRAYGEDGSFLMVGRCENGLLKTEKSFFEVD